MAIPSRDAPATGPAPLPRSFYARPTLVVARQLLGKLLVRRLDGWRLGGRIVEVEAYIGEGDTACHASKGCTPRNRVMFGPPGHAYVYFTYGMHWMLNVVTEEEGRPAAVLIRAIEPREGLERIRRLRPGRAERELTSGPARICAALAIARAQNGADLTRSEDGELWIEPLEDIAPRAIRTGPRIGIDYAEAKDRQAPWRFWIDGSPHVSRARLR